MNYINLNIENYIYIFINSINPFTEMIKIRLDEKDDVIIHIIHDEFELINFSNVMKMVSSKIEYCYVCKNLR